MNRRGFMGLFGAAAVAGPKAAAKVTADINALELPGIGLLGHLVDGVQEMNPNYGLPPSSESRIDWATKKLAKLMADNILDLNRKESEYWVNRLDANTHALRSVSLTTKMRITQKKLFRLEREREIMSLKRIIAGIDD